jgi:glycosyltransferase involved in cell wall biosynthesis
LSALKSISAQSFTDWEAIVIDDGSRDGTVDIARRWLDSRIRLIAEPQNGGHALRLNQAVDLASGQYIARMDGDDICLPERLERQVRFLHSHPEVDLVGCGTIVFANNGILHGRSRVRITHDEICRRPWAGFPLPHPTWMGRASWFRANRYCGRFVRAEDQELLLRAHGESRYACMQDILLAYRLDKLSIKKVIGSRVNFVSAFAGYAFGIGQSEWIPIAVVTHFAKAILDLGALLTGMDQRAIRARLDTNLTEDTRILWKNCYHTYQLDQA